MGFEVAFRRVVAPRCWDYVIDWQVIPDEPPRYLKAGGSLPKWHHWSRRLPRRS